MTHCLKFDQTCVVDHMVYRLQRKSVRSESGLAQETEVKLSCWLVNTKIKGETEISYRQLPTILLPVYNTLKSGGMPTLPLPAK